MKPKVIVIVGPTASGKSGVAIELAKKINGEIVSADSMQVYREMNIGTAKVTEEEAAGIKHYLIDVASPAETFNVAMYKSMAEEAIREIIAKGKTPIVVGGTGLYVSTLVNGIELSEVKNDDRIRKKLEERLTNEGIDVVFQELQKVDPEAAQVIDKNNTRRVIRALEIYEATGKTKTQLDRESIKEVAFDYQIFGILTDREELYDRLNKRVDCMIEQGLIEEVKSLREKYTFSQTALQGLGYKEVIEFLDGTITKEEMIEKLKMETRRYAKRQMTWFRRDDRIHWATRENILADIMSMTL